MEDDYQRMLRTDAEYAAAEKRFGQAVRDYLWDMTRLGHCPQWETDLDYALLAVCRVTLMELGYPYEPRTVEDTDEALRADIEEVLIGALDALADKLEGLSSLPA